MDVNSLLIVPPWEWPDDAGEIILETLTHKPAVESDRLTAAELASEMVVMNEELAEALLAIVRDHAESEELRGTAAIGLGPVLEQGDWELIDDEGFDDPEGVPISLDTFRKLRDSLHDLYLDESLPKDVRRRILEASVRSPQEWHLSAVKAAYASGDKDWMVTAIFSMGYLQGFEEQILEALQSDDPEIHYQAIMAAGSREVDAAWSHVVELVQSPATSKPLLLAAIEAVGKIRPREAGSILVDLGDSEDEDIAAAADEAMSDAQALSEESPGVDDDGSWLN
jgi:hypothetical protein